MIENWQQASDEEERFVQREAAWLLIFSVLACICILPVGALGIWQAYDTYAIYTDGFSIGFVLLSVMCGVVMLLALLCLKSFVRDYRNIRRGAIYRSNRGQVEKTWKEQDGNTVTEYFSFTYRDIVTGETKEYKSMNYRSKKDRLEVGDTLYVLAYKGDDGMEISAASKQEKKRKPDASWIVIDVAILAVMLMAQMFLCLDFGAASLYIRLGINLSLIAVAVVTFLYGIVYRKITAIVSALLLGGFIMLVGVPASLKNISLDMVEGPKECKAYLSSYETESVTRTRRGRRRIRHYYLDISSTETDIREVEVTGVAHSYYRNQYGKAMSDGKMIYYPHSKIFLYWLKDEEGSKV